MTLKMMMMKVLLSTKEMMMLVLKEMIKMVLTMVLQRKQFEKKATEGEPLRVLVWKNML